MGNIDRFWEIPGSEPYEMTDPVDVHGKVQDAQPSPETVKVDLADDPFFANESEEEEEDEHLEGFERVNGYKREESGTSEEEKDRIWGDRRRNGVQKELGGTIGKEPPSIRGSREWLYQRDDLKWPAGEGWSQLR